MTVNKNLVLAEEIIEAEIIPAEDMLTNFGLVDSGTVQGIATNMVEHLKGKVVGGYIPVLKSQIEKARSSNDFPPEWRKTTDVDGNEIIVRPARKVGGKLEQGDLLMTDAVRVTQKTLSRGLNPLAHISVWYQSGQLIDNVNYTILIGMAEQQGAFGLEFAEMSADDIAKHDLKSVDIGKVAYLIMDTDKSLLLQATMQFSPELGFYEGKRQALKMISKAEGIGIVRKSEGLYVLKGRSLDWLAEKRAGTDAIRRAFGEMTPAQIAHYASGQGFLQQEDLKTLASPDYQAVTSLPDEAQQRYLEVARVPKMSPEQIKEANDVMARNGDDDPIEDEIELAPSMEASTAFWAYANNNNANREFAGKFIRDAHGDFDEALKMMKKSMYE